MIALGEAEPVKTVSVEELSAHLKEHFDQVEQGETLTIIRDGRSIATIAPATTEESWFVEYDPSLRLQDFVPSLPAKHLKSNAVEMLIEDRESEWKKHGL